MKKSLICLLLVAVLLVGAVGCNKEDDGGAGTTAATTVATTTAATTKPQEKFYSEKLVKGYETDFVIVYDGNNEVIEDYVKAFCLNILDTYDIEIPFEPAGTKVNEKEIVVGNIRDCAKSVAEEADKQTGYAFKVEENAIVLYATSNTAYRYLFKYVRDVIFDDMTDGSLTVDSNDNKFCKEENLEGYTYLSYWREATGKSNEAFIAENFEHRSNKFEGTTLPYRLYVPHDYDPAKDYPVLLYMHGAGERGSDNANHIEKTGVMVNLFSLESAVVENAIVIAPQCPHDPEKWVDMDWSLGSYSVDGTPESNEIKCVLDILSDIKSEFSVDDKRVYVSGLSMGGIATWDLITRHGDLFAGAVPICGSGDATKAADLVDMPIWTVHSKDDPTVPFSGSKAMYDAIKNAGSTKVHFTELDGYGHNVWTYTTQNDDIYSWLFEQSK